MFFTTSPDSKFTAFEIAVTPPPAAAARLDSAPIPFPEKKSAARKAPARADRPFKGIALVLAFLREWRGSIIAPIAAHGVSTAHTITGWALERGYDLRGFEVSQPSLEDVYLRLTAAEAEPQEALR